MRVLPIALFLLIFVLVDAGPAQARAEINICNTGNTTTSVATVHVGPNNRWHSRGWYQVAPGGCRKVWRSPSILVSKVYLGFSQRGRGGRKGAALYSPQQPDPDVKLPFKWFCVHPKDPFDIAADRLSELASDCPDGYKLMRFSLATEIINLAGTFNIPADSDALIVPFRGAGEAPTAAAPRDKRKRDPSDEPLFQVNKNRNILKFD